MAKSMTAYGRARGTASGKDITVEIKSVNNRFFDCSVKLPRAFSFLEERVKPHLSSRAIARGKVDVFISIDVVDSPEVNIALDAGYAERYIAALRELGERFSLADDISIMGVAQNRDIFIQVKPEEDMESDWQAVKSVLDGAIDSFIAAREREGDNIARDLLSKIDNIERIVGEIDELSQTDTKSYRQKLEERLREMLAD